MQAYNSATEYVNPMHTIFEWGLQKRMAEVKSRYMLQETNQNKLKTRTL